MLFGESPSRIVISYATDNEDRVRSIVGDCQFAVIGNVEDDILRISVDGNEAIVAAVAVLESIWESSFASALGSQLMN